MRSALLLSSLTISAATGPPVYAVQFETDRGGFTVEVRRDWARLGADHFHELVRSGYYDNVKVFRAVRRFMVQFGIAARPGAFGSLATESIPDDPAGESNAYGTICFAMSGPGSRSTQVFISTRDNSYLDSMGFTPFGRVTAGMDVVNSLFTGYGEEPMQYNAQMQAEGNAFLERSFPRLSTIRSARLVPGGGGGGASSLYASQAAPQQPGGWAPQGFAAAAAAAAQGWAQQQQRQQQQQQALQRQEARFQRLGQQRGFHMPELAQEEPRPRRRQPPLEEQRYLPDDPLQAQQQRLNEMWEEKQQEERSNPAAALRAWYQRWQNGGGVAAMQPDNTM